MRNERNGSKTVKVTYDIGADAVAGIRRVAKDLHISVEDAARKLLAAGMMVEAANLAGYDVIGVFPDGTEKVISKAGDLI